MEYLLKVSAVVAIFYLIYIFFLQRDTFFESNRWFLLVGLITAFSIPFIIIPIYIEQVPVQLQSFKLPYLGDLEPRHNEKIEPFNILDYLPLVYAIGVLFFSIRFAFQLTSINKILRKGSFVNNLDYKFVKTTQSIAPFSFFKWIVLNPYQFKDNELEQIINHEKIHVKQHHSIDVLITQLSCILLWFNPFIWLYRTSLKQNLEFIADKYAQKQATCNKGYQYTLLKTSIPTHQLVITNNFYTSLIKKRIVMLHKSKSKKINLIKYALVVPLLATFLMSFNTEEVYVRKEKTFDVNSSSNAPYQEGLSETYHILDTQKDEDFEHMKKLFKTKGYSFKISHLKRSKKGLIIAINVNIKNETANADFNTSSILPIKAIKIVLDQEKNTISIGNLSDSDWKITTGFPSQEKADLYKDSKKLKKIILENNLKNALFILNDNLVYEDDIKDLNADDIDYINVLKGKEAIEKYGEKGKDGAIEITTKKSKWETKFITGKSMNDVEVIDYGDLKDKEVKKNNY